MLILNSLPKSNDRNSASVVATSGVFASGLRDTAATEQNEEEYLRMYM
ncbi:MAG: hypothetical protein ACRCXC_06080 [Legionella sp.]